MDFPKELVYHSVLTCFCLLSKTSLAFSWHLIVFSLINIPNLHTNKPVYLLEASQNSHVLYFLFFQFSTMTWCSEFKLKEKQTCRPRFLWTVHRNKEDIKCLQKYWDSLPPFCMQSGKPEFPKRDIVNDYVSAWDLIARSLILITAARSAGRIIFSMISLLRLRFLSCI